MRVSQVMTKNPETLPPNTTIQEVATEMKKLDCGFMPISKNGEILGTVTDRDIVIRALAKGKDPNTKISEIMTKDVYSVKENDDVKTVAEKMCSQQIRRVVVLDKDEHICGVVSLGDIAIKCKDHDLEGEIIEKVSENTH